MLNNDPKYWTSTYKYICYILILPALLALSCGGGARGEPTASTTTWTIEQFLSQDRGQEILEQTVEVRHCGLPEPQRIDCPAGGEAQFTYDLTATNLTPATLNPVISSILGIEPQQQNSLDLPVPAKGFITRYELVKQFEVIRGDATLYSSQGEQKNVAYTFVAACTIITQSQTTLDCETGQEVEPTSGGSVPTASTLEPTPTQLLIPAEPTITPTATFVPLGQNCEKSPGDTFVKFWESYRTLLGCPTSDLTIIPRLAEEAFQGGHLFWRDDTDRVYIIFDRRKNDNTELFEGRWELNPSERKWDGSNPDGIGLTPPSGLAEPKRGFGWLWRNHLGREGGPLGWALDREYGFDNTGQVQTFEQGLMFKGSTVKIYVLTNDGHFFANK